MSTVFLKVFFPVHLGIFRRYSCGHTIKSDWHHLATKNANSVKNIVLSSLELIKAHKMSAPDKEKEKEKEETNNKSEDLGLLEEDDEFEEFPAEGWTQ